MSFQVIIIIIIWSLCWDNLSRWQFIFIELSDWLKLECAFQNLFLLYQIFNIRYVLTPEQIRYLLVLLSAYHDSGTSNQGQDHALARLHVTFSMAFFYFFHFNLDPTQPLLPSISVSQISFSLFYLQLVAVSL